MRCLVLVAVLAVLNFRCGGSETVGKTGQAVIGFDGRTLYRGIFLAASGPVADKLPVAMADRIRLEEYIPDSTQRADFLARYDQIFTVMETIQPGYFDQFAQAIQSGNQFTIDSAITRAVNLTWQAINTMPDYQSALQAIQNDPSVRQQVENRYAQGIPTDQQLPPSEVDTRIQAFSQNKTDLGSSVVFAAFAFVYFIAAVDIAVVSNVVVAVSLAVAVAVVVPTWVAVQTATVNPCIKLPPFVATGGRSVAPGNLSKERAINDIATNLVLPPP